MADHTHNADCTGIEDPDIHDGILPDPDSHPDAHTTNPAQPTPTRTTADETTNAANEPPSTSPAKQQ